MVSTKPDSSQLASNVQPLVRVYINAVVREAIEKAVRDITGELDRAVMDSKQARIDSLQAKAISLDAIELLKQESIKLYGRE